jgi:hypothetical protein
MRKIVVSGTTLTQNTIYRHGEHDHNPAFAPAYHGLILYRCESEPSICRRLQHMEITSCLVSIHKNDKIKHYYQCICFAKSTKQDSPRLINVCNILLLRPSPRPSSRHTKDIPLRQPQRPLQPRRHPHPKPNQSLQPPHEQPVQYC